MIFIDIYLYKQNSHVFNSLPELEIKKSYSIFFEASYCNDLYYNTTCRKISEYQSYATSLYLLLQLKSGFSNVIIIDTMTQNGIHIYM